MLLDVGLELPWQGSSQAAQTIFKLKAFCHLVDYHDGVNDDNKDNDDDDDDARGGRGRAAK